VNATAKKNVMAQVKQDGIGIESDAFSVDELAALQRNIMEQLKVLFNII
jgi:hypothetical protein